MLWRIPLVLLVGVLALSANCRAAEADDNREGELGAAGQQELSSQPSEAQVLAMSGVDGSSGFDVEPVEDLLPNAGHAQCPVAQDGDNDGDNDGDTEQDKPEARGPAPWIEPSNRMDFLRLLETGFKWHYEKQYDAINKYLVEKLPHSHNVAQNLAEADALLEAERARGVWPFANRALVEALEQLLQLALLNQDDVRCSRQAYAILWKNNQAVRGVAQKSEKELAGLRRIELIINKASIRHSIDCFNHYPVKFVELRERMDARQLRLVQTFMDNYLESRTCILLPSRRFKAAQAAKLAHNLIESHSQMEAERKFLYKVINEVTGKLEVNREGVRRLVEGYIVEPCRAYVWNFGPDVFIPARFGARVLNQEDRYSNSEHMEFLHSWLHYRLCESLVRQDQDKNQLVKELVKYIWRLRPVESAK